MTKRRTESSARECSLSSNLLDYCAPGRNLNTSGNSKALFESLVRCLDLAELEETVLGALSSACPKRSAVVSLGAMAPEPSRIFSPEFGTRTWRTGDPIPPLLAVPIQDEREVLGWVAYIDEETASPEERREARRSLGVCAAAAGIPTRNAQRHANALNLALRDPLSGLYNRRAFDAFLEREARGVERTGRPLALIMIDLDDLKGLNDALGHPCGDEAIRKVAAAIDGSIRGTDICARLGGDEFAILLPESSPTEALRLATRIQDSLSKLSVARQGSLRRIEASMGIAELRDAEGQPAALVSLADDALYRAKRTGRNRICCANAQCVS